MTPIPFQFSLGVIRNGTPLIKKSYLTQDPSKDPRYDLAIKLIESVGKSGSIVTYNMSFEKGRIQELADQCPRLKPKLLAIKNRVVDLLDVIKPGIYHPDFNFSWSIKSVVPELFGPSECYSSLVVKNGLQAQELYLKAIESSLSEQTKKDLIDYCNKDVIEMIKLYLLAVKLSDFKNKTPINPDIGFINPNGPHSSPLAPLIP